MEKFKQFLVALLAAVAVGFVSIVIVLIWIFHFKEGLAWDGGLGEFNWHPLLIVTGFIFIQGLAILVYRLPWTWQCSKRMMKLIHAGLHMLAFLLAAISLVAVFDFHNARNIPNMYSLHSWVGLSAVTLFSLQLVLGVCVYLLPITPVSLRAAFMPLHVFSGLLIFTSVIAAALMGITEKLIFGLNDPKYKDSPPEAILVNVLGILIALFGALVLWIVTRSSWKRPGNQVVLAKHGEGSVSAGPKVTAMPQITDHTAATKSSGNARRRSYSLDDSE